MYLPSVVCRYPPNFKNEKKTIFPSQHVGERAKVNGWERAKCHQTSLTHWPYFLLRVYFTEGWTSGQGNEAESGAGPQGTRLYRHTVVQLFPWTLRILVLSNPFKNYFLLHGNCGWPSHQQGLFHMHSPVHLGETTLQAVVGGRPQARFIPSCLIPVFLCHVNFVILMHPAWFQGGKNLSLPMP